MHCKNYSNLNIYKYFKLLQIWLCNTEESNFKSRHIQKKLNDRWKMKDMLQRSYKRKPVKTQDTRHQEIEQQISIEVSVSRSKWHKNISNIYVSRGAGDKKVKGK